MVKKLDCYAQYFQKCEHIGEIFVKAEYVFSDIKR